MIPLTGTITSAQLRAELGLAAGAPFAMSDAAVRRLTGKAAGTTQNASDLRGCHLARINAVGVNAHVAMGSPVEAGVYRFVQEPGVTFGSNSATIAAFAAGQFPAGSTVTVDLRGNVHAAGGAPNGGTGGPAVWADYAGYTLTVNANFGTSQLYGGGGGGGLGGTGGQGGPAAGTVTEGPLYSELVYEAHWVNLEEELLVRYYWGGVLVGEAGTDGSTNPVPITVGGVTYTPGALQSAGGNQRHYALSRTTSGTGAPGGAGGAGGAGGRGQGYDGAAAGGAAGGAGSPGSGGSGAGGAGGAGGSGASFGNQGFAGTVGFSGIAGSGGAGFAGGAASAGGLGGYYAYKNGRGNVTFNLSGALLGRLG